MAISPRKYKVDAPKLIQRADGTDAWVFEGQEATNVGLNADAGRPPRTSTVPNPTKLSEIGEGCYNIHERIRDMNANGVDMVAWECDYPHSDSTWPLAPE